jgi:hypothetical protein
MHGTSPDYVARRLIDALEEGELFVFTDSAMRGVIEERHRRIMRGLERADSYQKTSQN